MHRTRSDQRSDRSAKVPQWFQTFIRPWWKKGATAIILLAALTTIFVNMQTIEGLFNDDPPQVEETGGDESTPIRIAPDPDENADEDGAPEHPQHTVLVGFSRAELRTRNALRKMLDTEDGQVLSRLIGVYGFASPSSLRRRLRGPDDRHPVLRLSTLTLSHENGTGREVEVHALGEGRVMVLVNVSQGDAARLSDPTGDVGEILGFFLDGYEARAITVGIPVSRIRTWQYRTLKFAEIDVN